MKALIGKTSNQDNQDNIALLVIDVQQGLFEKTTPIYGADELLQNLNDLVDRAHNDNIPVFFIQHSDPRNLVKGSPSWKIHPQLQPLSIDNIVHKQHGNAFKETNLDETLRAKNVSRVVITGLVSHGCVRATCVGALNLGYRVILVKDGHSNYSKQASKIIEELNQKLSEMKVDLKSTSEIVFI
jgi:nicotinamidase-related amidase